MEDSYENTTTISVPSDGAWKTVTNPKRRKSHPLQNKNDNKPLQNGSLSNGVGDKDGNVFSAIEEKSRDRRRRVVEAQRAVETADLDSLKFRSKTRRGDDSDDDDDDSEAEEGKQNGVVEEDKKKQKKKKKEKKPKVTVAEAAAKIVTSDLEAFIADVTGSYGSQEDIQLMRFADYFGRAFSGVGAAQFPWVKIFRESTVAKLTEIPLSNVPDAVHKVSVEWISQRSVEALNSFVLGLLDSILSDLASQIVSVKGSKKGTPQPSSKSQVAVFVVLAMVLRRKPEALVNVLPTLRENAKYQGQDKLPIMVWMTCQACQGDLPAGLHAWAHNLLPVLNSKSSNNPQSRDLILQLVERIVSAPKARSILMSNAVRKGERLIPPSSFETLIRVTFPASSARVKATERFEAVYPTLKEIALAGVPGSKAMKQVSLQIFSIAIKAAGENIPELSEEGASVFIWSLAQNSDCYKHWDKLYPDNLEASVAILRKMSEQWKELNLSQPSREALKATLKSFQQKNENTLAGEDASKEKLLKNADKYCKLLAGRLSSGHGCLKATAVLAIMAVGAAAISTNMDTFDLKKLSVMLSSFQTV
ncbi:hypothetical protein V2J09_020584 [Rumex salicifolius]